MKKGKDTIVLFVLLFLLLIPLSMKAKDYVLKEYRQTSPYTLKRPFIVDTTDVNGKKFSDKTLLKNFIPTDGIPSGSVVRTNAEGELALPFEEGKYLFGTVSFSIKSDRYATADLVFSGIGNYEVYIDNMQKTPVSGKIDLELEPQTYNVVVKYLSEGKKREFLKTVLKTDSITQARIDFNYTGEKTYTIKDVIKGKKFNKVSLSPDGRFVIAGISNTLEGGKEVYFSEVIDRTNGKTIYRTQGDEINPEWMPVSNLFYFTRKNIESRELITVDPLTKEETVLCNNLPEGDFIFSPDEKHLFFTLEEKGPEERKDVFEVLTPDDRQAGWRNRSFIHLYDLNTGLMQRLTFGHNSTFLNDISKDGSKILFSTTRTVLSSQPFEQTSMYIMDIHTFKVDTVFKDEKFISNAVFSPDAKYLLIHGSGNALENIGLNIKEGTIANLSDGQLFLYDLQTKKASALTKYFNPSVEQFEWNKNENQIYFLGTDRDCMHLFNLDPVSKKIKMIPTEEEVVYGYSFASESPEVAYYGASVSNSQRLYAENIQKNTSICLDDLSKERLKGIKLGEVKDWNFVSLRGDTITGRFYLPPDFDSTKKYPMIVNYYGGTLPTSRDFESRYPQHAYAAQGYVVYVLNPSGTTGFGQDFSARHVNAWGNYTADEIIEGTKKFCEEHSFVDKTKIGCIGASYGGFMTQYLMTKTDIFAAAISHAGISNITSYWGQGYWGYSYNEIAAFGSYPWNNKALFTDHSPLFSADKVKTPLLFLHGTSDHNVPLGESIQMFTALKLLGKPTALVEIEGQDHHILDYNKRIRWQNTIFAWFAKWLKNEPQWWDATYPPKKLE